MTLSSAVSTVDTVAVIDWDTQTQTELARVIKEVFRDSGVKGVWILHTYNVNDFCLQSGNVVITVSKLTANDESGWLVEIDNNGIDRIAVRRLSPWANVLHSALKAW